MSGWSTGGLMMRARVLMALGVVMMLAAAMAGIAGHGLAGFGLMVAAFWLARLLGKPWLVTRAGQPGGAAALSRELAGQVAVVLVVFWLGVGIGWATGWHPVLPLGLPVAVALAAGILSRLVWRPMPPEFDSFLDEATATITRMTEDLQRDLPPEPDHDPQALAEMIAALDGQPVEGASHYDLVDVLLEGMGRMPVPVFVDTLFDRAHSKTERDLRALVIGLTDPWIANKILGQRDLEAAFEIIVESGNQNAIEAWANGISALVSSVPLAAVDMPSPERLRIVGAMQFDYLREKLTDLADHLESLTRETEG